MIFKQEIHNIPYTLKISSTAKNLRLTVKPGGELIVTKPKNVSTKHIDSFIVLKKDWILKTIEKAKLLEPATLQGPLNDFIKNKPLAKEIARKKVEHFIQFYNYKYSRISIKNSNTQWGSCSTDRNLTFHYKIVYLPENLLDYLIVHEICHLKEMNHSTKYWELVKQTIPNYRVLRKELRKLKI